MLAVAGITATNAQTTKKAKAAKVAKVQTHLQVAVYSSKAVVKVKIHNFENKIDEIYCSINEISNEKHKELVAFADDNDIIIKFIPDSKEIFSKNLTIDYYELFPVLSLKKSPLDDYYTEFFKRLFDIFFSLIVILFILSFSISCII